MENEMFKKSLIIVGCVAAGLLTASTANAQSYGKRGYCDDYARRVSYRGGDGNADRVVGGALTGAILGGAFGAITGNGQGSNIGTGVAVGGVTGGLIGAGALHGRFNRRSYDRAYWSCMNQSDFRGYGRPARYSRDVEYCISRFRSYNPNTGVYLSNSGRYVQCP